MITHVNNQNLPNMVDITDKNISVRMAQAESWIQLPIEFKNQVQGQEITLKKGPVFQTAIIAATQAVKKTYEVIPFCHQIPIEACQIKISINEDLLVHVQCEVKTTYKTGVEMEALHGATIAALTIYDMCKALSHDIQILKTQLVAKTGGKSTKLDLPIYGLVLTGGKSERMQQDKALLDYHGKPQAEYIYEILSKFCDQVYLSAQQGQWDNTPLENLPMIYDEPSQKGPIGGILAAFNKEPNAYWFVVACDLIYFNKNMIEKLLSTVDQNKVATCFKNAEKGFPEALCAIYSPIAKAIFTEALNNDIRCPVKVLKTQPIHLLDIDQNINLANINTRDEYNELKNKGFENEKRTH